MTIGCNENVPKIKMVEHVKRERKKKEIKKKKLKKVKQQLVKANTINSKSEFDEFDESNGDRMLELHKINWEEKCNRRRVQMAKEEEDKMNEDDSSEPNITMKDGWYWSES